VKCKCDLVYLDSNLRVGVDLQQEKQLEELPLELLQRKFLSYMQELRCVY
jgi:hypothetical protein